jgi:medium-chain acyl-[acyl-carrier-protein] hydrolase
MPPDKVVRLFCFPNAGAGAASFRGWASSLPQDVEVVPVHLPGREQRFAEPAFTALAPLVETLANDLSFDSPFAFFGHSMGALIAFELARKHPPQALLVSGHRAPHLPHLGPKFHTAPDDILKRELKRLGGTQAQLLQDDDFMRIVLPTLRADWTLWETYQHVERGPLETPITVFGGADDTEASYFELLEWQRQTTQAFRLRVFPGDHFFLTSAKRLFLKALSEELTYAASAPSRTSSSAEPRSGNGAFARERSLTR